MLEDRANLRQIHSWFLLHHQEMINAVPNQMIKFRFFGFLNQFEDHIINDLVDVELEQDFPILKS